MVIVLRYFKSKAQFPFLSGLTRTAPRYTRFRHGDCLVIQKKEGDSVMLILQRKIGQEIVIPTRQACVRVLDIGVNKVSLGVSAPLEVPVHRKETWNRIQAQATESQKHTTERIRVLIADPNQYLLVQNCNYLESCGFEVSTATRSEERRVG